jgi:hypothetical protein
MGKNLNEIKEKVIERAISVHGEVSLGLPRLAV